jgi:hypothetical protein
MWTSHDCYIRKIKQTVSVVVREPMALEVKSANVPEPENMITQVFAAAAAREAFDLIEKDPQRTLKIQLDFS